MANIAQPFTSSLPIVDVQTGKLTSIGLQTLNQLVSAINGNTNNQTNVTSAQIGGLSIYVGSGSPAGIVAASPGALYISSSGGADATLYVKESGTDASGWAGK